jgi:hypothetical protein
VNPIQLASKQFELMYWDLARALRRPHTHRKKGSVKALPPQTGRAA